MLKTIIVAACVYASACVDDGVAGQPGSLPVDDEVPDDPVDSTPVDSTLRQRSGIPDPEVCAMLPSDDEACAHACDADALMQYIPEGTCAMFTCPLSDGTTFTTGGCNS